MSASCSIKQADARPDGRCDTQPSV